jgi:prevent-host-death family protein
MTINSTEFKTHLGEYLAEAIHRPVFVKRHSQEVVLLSKKEYERLQKIEDAYWLNEAALAENDGYIGVEKTMKKLKNALDKSE